MARTQEYRQLAVGTPLGDDALLLRSFSGTETLSRLFSYRLEFVSEDPDIQFKDIVGQNVTVRVQPSPSDEPRYFNGYLSTFEHVRSETGVTRYAATMVPWLWFLTLTSDCRIFQAMQIPDIIKQVFRELGFTDVEDRLSGQYVEREYCVQYRETHFNFISRLMEQEGIYYYFKHENGKHTLILCDGRSSHEPYPGYEKVKYYPPTESIREAEYVHEWVTCQAVQSGTYSHTDFDFTKPRTLLLSSSKITRSWAVPPYEIFDFPGEYVEQSAGQEYARKRIEEIQTDYEISTGDGNVRGIATGFTVEMENLPRSEMNKEYLVIAASITADSDEFGAGESGGYNFGVTFHCIDESQQFRAACSSPRPLIQGCQTAIVVGPGGEEIHTDSHGRVKVQFHWDRYSKTDENSSCWIRVSQPWAGKKWGAIFLPRIGQEVIVEFLEGDPDRPIITGRVYNGTEKPPYDLPGNATRSTVKSNSSKGGDGWNEIRFEDKAGSEQIFIHSQKNTDERVLNDSKEWIGNDRHLIVKKKQYELVEEEKHLIVKQDQKEKVEGDLHLKVVGNQNEKVDQTISREAGMNLQEKVGTNWASEAGQEIHLKAGMNVVIESGMELTIKAGGAFVKLDMSGVTISGTMVKINSGGAAGSGSGSSPEAPVEPEEAKEADDDNTGEISEPAATPTPPTPETYSAQAQVMKMAAVEGTPFCAVCAAAAAARARQGASSSQGGQQQSGADRANSQAQSAAESRSRRSERTSTGEEDS